MAKARKLFVNLPVRDLKRTTAFFTALGFEFDPNFTDENATCMLIGEDAYAMLLVRPFFEGFVDRQIVDTSTHIGVILAVTCDSREHVDAQAEAAIAAGGKAAKAPQDHGFMYSRDVYDLDGHQWSLFWMDPAAMAPQA